MRKAATVMVLMIFTAATAILHGSTLAQSLTRPEISIHPGTYVANTTGATFTIEVWINDSVEVAGYDVNIRFDPGILIVSGWQTGGFLESSGVGASFTPADHSIVGWVAFGGVLLEPGSASGNGTLVRVNFTIIGGGRCALDLYNTELLDEDNAFIDHTSMDGLFVLNYISLTPSSGIAAFAIEGFGFAQNADITSITWNGTELPVPSITTDGRGNFLTIAVVPDISTPGNYTIRVGDSPGNHKEAVFTLVQAAGAPGPQGPAGPQGQTGPQGPAGTSGQMEYVWAAIILAVIAMIVAIYALSRRS